MLMESEQRLVSDLVHGNGNCSYGRFDGDYDFLEIVDRTEGYREKSPSSAKILPEMRSLSPSSPSTSSPPLSSSPCGRYIEHRVSKFDTLAGIAIKYGVEVADIKKLNGLATDLQMFALKTLQIPLPGRHPPSPCLSNGSVTPRQSNSGQSSWRREQHDLLDSFQSLKLKSSDRKVSPAMSSLQGFYGLKATDKNSPSEGFEMAVYNKGSGHFAEDGSYLKASPSSAPPFNRHRKSRSLVNALLDDNNELAESLILGEAGEINSDKQKKTLVRRRQKSENDFTSRTPEKLLKADNSSGGLCSSITGKGLALRSKAASRTGLAPDSEAGCCSTLSINLMDSLATDNSSMVRKSSSTPSLQDQDSNNNISCIWPTSKWTLKPDLLTTAAITSSIFDGLPKPLTGRRNKAALD